MPSLTYYLENLSDSLDTVFRFVLFITLSSMIVVITAQVIFRFFFTALSWTEELSRYLLVWSSFIGATVGFKKGSHIAITFVVDSLSLGIKKKLLKTIACILMAIFFGVTIWQSISLFQMQVFQTSPAIGLKMRYVYMIIPISFSVMFIHLLRELTNIWSTLPPKEA